MVLSQTVINCQLAAKVIFRSSSFLSGSTVTLKCEEFAQRTSSEEGVGWNLNCCTSKVFKRKILYEEVVECAEKLVQGECVDDIQDWD